MDSFDRRREIYVQRRALGIPQARAAEDAGLTTKQAVLFEKSPLFEKLYKDAVSKADEEFTFTLNEVLREFKKAADIAKAVSEPASIVAAWREIAKIMGYYAPERKIVHLTAEGELMVSSMRQLPDHELMKLAEQGVRVIEAEARRLPDPNAPQ